VVLLAVLLLVMISSLDYYVTPRVVPLTQKKLWLRPCQPLTRRVGLYSIERLSVWGSAGRTNMTRRPQCSPPLIAPFPCQLPNDKDQSSHIPHLDGRLPMKAHHRRHLAWGWSQPAATAAPLPEQLPRVCPAVHLFQPQDWMD
jgi:hypothetical protein